MRGEYISVAYEWQLQIVFYTLVMPHVNGSSTTQSIASKLIAWR